MENVFKKDAVQTGGNLAVFALARLSFDKSTFDNLVRFLEFSNKGNLMHNTIDQ